MLADRLKMSIEEVQQKTSSSHFRLWMQYFLEEVNYFHREDYYFAQIAMLIHNIFASKENIKEIKDFILKFKLDDLSERDVVESYNPEEEEKKQEEKKKASLEREKAGWGGFIKRSKAKPGRKRLPPVKKK